MNAMNQAALPTTVESAVHLLIGIVPEDEQAKISALSETRLFELHFGLGQWVRNNLGLWNPNSRLLNATAQTNADDASDVIVQAFWLQQRDMLPKIH